jgi:hypothetical protein
MIMTFPLDANLSPDPSHIDDLKMAASKMTDAKRRVLLAEIAFKYCVLHIGSK